MSSYNINEVLNIFSIISLTIYYKMRKQKISTNERESN